jgi:FkbM family methyltransferase
MTTSSEFPEDAPMASTFTFELHGIALEIPRSILTPELWGAFKGGYYEGSELSALRSVVRPDDKILEIGAGIGFVSAYLLRVLGAARVWAVEADTRLLPIIRRTYELNAVSGTLIHGVACRHDAEARFHLQPSFWASSVIASSETRRSQEKGLQQQSRSLDHAIEHAGTSCERAYSSQMASEPLTLPGVDVSRLVREFRPDVMVVDIEGGEGDLFSGLKLPGIRSLVVEVHQSRIGGQGIARCFAALHQAGFAYDPNGSQGSNVVFTRFHSPRGRLVSMLARTGRSAS